MTTNPKQELIWQGRIHLGDEPGIYGCAHYSGLSADLPITVYRSDHSSTQDSQVTLILDTEGVQTYAGYPGHVITVTVYEPDPTKPFHSIERIIAQTLLTPVDNNNKEIQVSLGATSGPFFLSIRLRSDTAVNPGLYDDFVLVGLSFRATDSAFYASFGFRNA